MPTVETVTHKIPNTPWRMVPDVPRHRLAKGGGKRKPAVKQPALPSTPEDVDSEAETESLHRNGDLTQDMAAVTPGVTGPSRAEGEDLVQT